MLKTITDIFSKVEPYGDDCQYLAVIAPNAETASQSMINSTWYKTWDMGYEEAETKPSESTCLPWFGWLTTDGAWVTKTKVAPDKQKGLNSPEVIDGPIPVWVWDCQS